MITQSEGVNVLLLFLLAGLPFIMISITIVLIMYDVAKRKLRKITIVCGIITLAGIALMNAG